MLGAAQMKEFIAHLISEQLLSTVKCEAFNNWLRTAFLPVKAHSTTRDRSGSLTNAMTKCSHIKLTHVLGRPAYAKAYLYSISP